MNVSHEMDGNLNNFIRNVIRYAWVWYCYVTEWHAYDFVVKDFVIKKGHYLCQTLYINKLVFFIKRAKSQLCVHGKYTTVASCTELTPCRRRRAEASLSFKHAPVIPRPDMVQRNMESWPWTLRPVKWPCSLSCCLAPTTGVTELHSIQGLSSPAPPCTLRWPVPSAAWNPSWALSGVLAHCQTSPGCCLISHWLSRCRGTTFYSFFKIVSYVLFKCVC